MKPQVLLILHSPFEECAGIFKGFMQYQSANRPWGVTVDTEMRPERDRTLIQSQKWHGIVSRNTSANLIQTCAGLGVPLIDLDDSPPIPGVTKISPDNGAIGRLGAEYFIDRKFKHFGFCGFSNQSSSRERQHGFVEGLRLAGFNGSVFESEQRLSGVVDWYAPPPEGLDDWLRGLPAGAGVMACDDLRALEVIRAAENAGRHVPEELAVLGVNNDTMRCEMVEPSLSSVALNAPQTGICAAEQLEKILLGGKYEPLHIRLDPAGIITRKSTDVLALRDQKVAMAVSYIRQNACRGLTVEQVLDHVLASRSQLEYKFRQFLGRSPQVEIRWVQVEKVRQLLRETNLPLKDIAESAGFAHVEYMSVVFKRLTGETPGHFRKRCQATELIWATT